MITALRLLEFQKHRKLVVRFDPHVTTIVGQTDSGKTSILRALLWLLTNSPAGMEFIHYGSKRVEVDLRVDDCEIRRIRSSTINSYALIHGESFKSYKAFGTEVPPDIARVMRVGPINVQNQHDAPFWFSLSRPEVSRQLNEIVNLGVIDRCLSGVATIVREGQARVVVSEERLEKQVALKRSFRWALEADADLKAVEKLAAVADAATQQVERLGGVVWGAEKQVMELRYRQRRLEDLQGLVAVAEHLDHAAQDRQRLQARIHSVSQTAHEFHLARDAWTVAQANYNQHIKGQVCPLCHGKGKL